MKEQIEMYVWVTGPPRFSSYFLISPVTAACAFTEMLSSPKVFFTVMFDVQHLCFRPGVSSLQLALGDANFLSFAYF